MSGFRFEETMSGTYTRDGDERAFKFTAVARVGQIGKFITDRRATISGHVDASGLASHAPLAGSMVIDPVLGRVIAYEFGFTGDDGRGYRFIGQKDVTPREPLRSMTTLPGEILDEKGARYATAALMFDLRDLGPFLSSFRPVL